MLNGNRYSVAAVSGSEDLMRGTAYSYHVGNIVGPLEH